MDNYDIDGVHLDYIRYKGSDMCFCEHCKTTFERETGVDILKVESGSAEWARFLTSRTAYITNFVRRVWTKAKERDLEVSAAVFTGYPGCIVSIGQDWVQWAKDGLVDYLFPMTYTNDANRVTERTTRHIAAVNSTCPVWEGLGKKSSASQLTPQMLMEQIERVKAAGAQGIVIFSYSAIEDEDLRLLKDV